jgi:serine/threonine-protein kinase
MKRCPICRTTYPGNQAQFCPADGTVLETVTGAVDSLVGTTLEAKYRIESRIGAGGMGAVYKAHHLMLGRDVAVKVLHAAMLADAKAAERFRREAQAAARIEHANAVTIYDFGISADGSAYLVMELLRGTSLRDVLDRDGALTLGRTVEIFVQVCAGIDRAHQLGIIHRDIKPDNIMVDERADGTTGVKVVDFGIAMLQDLLNTGSTRLTGTGMVVGTANYMSPEHCRGADVDARSDIYSLGIVLYEMLTGRVPFSSPVASAVIVAHVNEPPPPLGVYRQDVPPAVERVVLGALAKRPEDRPPTAAELARRLTDAARGSAVAMGTATVPVGVFPRPSTGAPGATTDGRPPAGTIPVTTPAEVRPSGSVPTPPTIPVQAFYASGPAPAAPARRGLSPVIVAVVVFAMLAISVAIAVAAFGVMYWRGMTNTNIADNPPRQTNTSPPSATNVAPLNVAPKTDPTTMPPNLPPIAPPPPQTDEASGPQPLSQDQEREVQQFLTDWLASSQARDVEWQMRHYADVVDYYKAGPVPRIRIRADRVRAYMKFDQIRIRITAIYDATIDRETGEIRLVFEKEWYFSGPDGDSTGKVKELLGLRRIGGELKIVKEQDLVVY